MIQYRINLVNFYKWFILLHKSYTIYDVFSLIIKSIKCRYGNNKKTRHIETSPSEISYKV